jgi:hypothetical protein
LGDASAERHRLHETDTSIRGARLSHGTSAYHRHFGECAT